MRELFELGQLELQFRHQDLQTPGRDGVERGRQNTPALRNFLFDDFALAHGAPARDQAGAFALSHRYKPSSTR
jgi:hypothetical protein